MRLIAISNQDLTEQTCLVFTRTADAWEVDAEAAGLGRNCYCRLVLNFALNFATNMKRSLLCSKPSKGLTYTSRIAQEEMDYSNIKR